VDISICNIGKRYKQNWAKENATRHQKHQAVSKLIAKEGETIKWYFYRKKIDDFGAQTIAMELVDPNCKVTELNLSYNQISDVGAETIAEALPKSKVTKLDLGSNIIGDAGAKAIAMTLKDPNCKVTELNLSYNQISDAGAKAIALALKDPNCKVTELEFSGNQISDVGAEAIAMTLPNSQITTFTLGLGGKRGEKFSTDSVRALSAALKDPKCKVSCLNLANQIDDEAIKDFAEAVISARLCQKRNLSIRYDSHFLMPNLSESLAPVIPIVLDDPNYRITDLNLARLEIGDTGVRYIVDALRNPKYEITKLDLSNNHIEDVGAEAVASALIDPNCKVTELIIWHNQISDVGMKAVTEALPKSKVTKLSIGGKGRDKISDASEQAIAAALKDPNCKITELNLSNIKGIDFFGGNGGKVIEEAVNSVKSSQNREIKIGWYYTNAF
ncbi:MAG: hypothetical protein ACD_58C00293G0001, partial [uncultured bacterium]